jgi:FAD/FMN-containing dehydrogenase/Fe-S oxidoreductase
MSAVPTTDPDRELRRELEHQLGASARFDAVQRVLFSTDASNHQVLPLGVVQPEHEEQVHAVLETAARLGVPTTPRGAGTGLAGAAIGRGLILDTARYLDHIIAIDWEGRTACVQPGVVLDVLNHALAPEGFMVGPDPASGDRATLGGMIGTNASGAHSIRHGMMADQVLSLDLWLAGGESITLEAVAPERAMSLSPSYPHGRVVDVCLQMRRDYERAIEAHWPRTWRRASGYGINYLTGYTPSQPAAWDERLGAYAEPAVMNLPGMFCGSEGTLGIVRQAVVRIVPRPAATILVLLSYPSIHAACDDTPRIVACAPDSLELIPRTLLQRARDVPAYARRLSFVDGDPEAMLVAEFSGESEKGALAAASGLAGQGRLVTDPQQQADIWAVRKGGLGLLMSIPGDTKPIEFVEDVAVPLERLGTYAREVDRILAEHGTTAEWYAHASVGCLHMRPLLNLKSESGVRNMNRIAHAVADLALEMNGSLSGEHGDGLSRTRFNRQLFGERLYGAFGELKRAFDPSGLMNPGKIVEIETHANEWDSSLRYGPGYQSRSFPSVLSFRREGDFGRAVETCNGAGVCLKAEGVMCPSYQATRHEGASTRGRANALRAALAGAPLALSPEEVLAVLDLCLSCKGCKAECPSAVDMAKLKAAYLSAYQDDHGVPLRSRILGGIRPLSQAASHAPALVNAIGRSKWARALAARGLGIASTRTLPQYAAWQFSDWFQSRTSGTRSGSRPVVFFVDTYTEFMAPEVGVAAVEVLEAAGFRVELAEGQGCCGRPHISKGMLTEARREAAVNLEALAPWAGEGVPIVGLEPSCLLTLRDEVPDFFPGDPRARQIAHQAVLIEELLTRPDAAGVAPVELLRWATPKWEAFVHNHCHARSLVGPSPMRTMLEHAALVVVESPAGCCGMAGSFGYEMEHAELSMAIGEQRLLPAVRSAEARGAQVLAAGMSCRSQIEDGCGARARHPIEFVREALAEGTESAPP